MIAIDELRKFPCWVCWREEAGPDGKKTKIPYNPKTGGRASSTDKTTWADFETAQRQAHRYSGIGFVFDDSNPFTGIDLDKCIIDDQVEPWAMDIVNKMNSYTEYSPSGKGLHIIVGGKLPKDCGRKRKGKIEMYSRARYFTWTGNRFEGTPETIEQRENELLELHKSVFAELGEKPKPQVQATQILNCSDDDILKKAREAKNGKKFSALFDNGDTSGNGGDDSAADLALCNLLAFWCGNDFDGIDRLFRQSKLCRDKWLNRADYRKATIDTAIKNNRETYPSMPAATMQDIHDKSRPVKLVLKQLSDVSPKKIEWIWPNRIPRGMFSLIVGPSGVGKSFLEIYMSAVISQGWNWPDCGNPNGKGSVIIFTDEESLEYSIRPRLDACGADCNKVFAYDHVLLSNGKPGFFDITEALHLLDKELAGLPGCQAVFFDCLIGFLGETDNNSNSEVRQALTPLAELAERRNIAIIGVSHFNKKIDLDAKDRVIGSGAFAAVSRSVWAVVLDKDSPEENTARLFLPVKNNYAVNPTGSRFRINDGAVCFEREVLKINVNDAISRDKGGRQAKSQLEATEWLQKLLQDGQSMPSKEIFEQAKIVGISDNAIKAARKNLQIQTWKSGYHDGWVWALPKSEENDTVLSGGHEKWEH